MSENQPNRVDSSESMSSGTVSVSIEDLKHAVEAVGKCNKLFKTIAAIIIGIVTVLSVILQIMQIKKIETYADLLHFNLTLPPITVSYPGA